MATMTPAQRVAAYIKLRNFKKAAEEEFKQSMQRTVDAMEKLEGLLLNDLNTTGANSLSCDDGTVYKNIQLSATVEDRERFLEHIRAHGMWEALDVKANKTFVREHMEQTKQGLPGVKITQVATVGVRKA